jgi:DNA polymerase
MDRNEAVLRELNLYPQWKRRDQPALAMEQPSIPVTPAGSVAVQDIATLAPPPESAGAGPASAPVPGTDGLDWPELKQQVRDCTACRLRAGCTQTVFGVGDEQAEWLFVGEGPGADEDAQGEPFIGQAGKLLDSMLAAIKLKRGDNVYIANIVKCRPPDNRTPGADEIATCLPYLQQQITLIKPRLIVALGKTAATALLGRDATLGSLRGTLHDFKLPAIEFSGAQEQESSQPSSLPHPLTSSHRVGTIPLIVTYHPAYLLRSPMEKAKAWQDLCFAVDVIQKA